MKKRLLNIKFGNIDSHESSETKTLADYLPSIPNENDKLAAKKADENSANKAEKYKNQPGYENMEGEIRNLKQTEQGEIISSIESSKKEISVLKGGIDTNETLAFKRREKKVQETLLNISQKINSKNEIV